MFRCISETVKDTAIVTIEDNRNTSAICRMVPFPMTASDPDVKVMPIFDAEYIVNGRPIGLIIIIIIIIIE